MKDIKIHLINKVVKEDIADIVDMAVEKDNSIEVIIVKGRQSALWQEI